MSQPLSKEEMKKAEMKRSRRKRLMQCVTAEEKKYEEGRTAA